MRTLLCSDIPMTVILRYISHQKSQLGSFFAGHTCPPLWKIYQAVRNVPGWGLCISQSLLRPLAKFQRRHMNHKPLRRAQPNRKGGSQPASLSSLYSGRPPSANRPVWICLARQLHALRLYKGSSQTDTCIRVSFVKALKRSRFVWPLPPPHPHRTMSSACLLHVETFSQK